MFNVKLGNQRLVRNLDLAAKVGKNSAYDEYIEFYYRPGAIYRNNEKVSGGI